MPGGGHKESWFGSFGGGRKSTENAFQGIGKSSFSLGEPSSQNHKFSITGAILNKPKRDPSETKLEQSNETKKESEAQRQKSEQNSPFLAANKWAQ